MKLINFMNIRLEDAAVYDLLVHCACCSFGYYQSAGYLSDEGYYISRKQYEAFCNLVDEQMYLDIGPGQAEWKAITDYQPVHAEEL